MVLNLGDALWSDFNTSGFTNNLDLDKVLNLAPLFVEGKESRITNVYLSELLDHLLNEVKPISYKPDYVKPILQNVTTTTESLTLKSFYAQLINFIDSSDNLIIETGSSSLNIPKLELTDGANYHNQTLWGSIGWATPATLGIALADKSSRAILVTGEGSHQLTLNELGVMGRYEINPIIFCINNNGFMVERALEIDPDPSYDDLAQLNYSMLPEAFGCNNWITFKVKTEQELASAMLEARKSDYGVYIELITGKYDYGSALQFFNSHLKEMYGQ